MNRNTLRLLGVQIFVLGIILSVIDFFIDNSPFILLIGGVLIVLSLLLKK